MRALVVFATVGHKAAPETLEVRGASATQYSEAVGADLDARVGVSAPFLAKYLKKYQKKEKKKEEKGGWELGRGGERKKWGSGGGEVEEAGRTLTLTYTFPNGTNAKPAGQEFTFVRCARVKT